LSPTEIDYTIATVFAHVLDIQRDEYSDALSSDDVANWDSIAHLTLIMSLEQAFGIRFPPNEAPALMTVGEIKAAVAKRCS
jgi:acyl carrier protein